MNTFTAPARLVADPELREAGGHPVLNLRLAVNTGFGQNQSTLFMNAAKWGKGADKLCEMLFKGSFVVVSGELSQREYEHDGQTRQALELRVDRLDLGPKTSIDTGGVASTATKADDDEIPF